MRKNSLSFAGCGLLAVLMTNECMVGPKYRQPAPPITPAFKESLPEGWKLAEPRDGHIPTKWWEMYNDPQLNALEEQVAISNQKVLSFAAQYQEARDAVRIAHSNLFPTISAGLSITHSLNANTNVNTASGQHTFYSLQLGVSWEPTSGVAFDAA